MPVFASNWCLRTRSARVSASLMSISSNKIKSSQARKASAPSKGCGNIWGGVSTRVCGACDARRERMGRIRSARVLQLLMPLTGERFPGVRGRVCAGGKIWGGNFDPRERGRRGGRWASVSREARGGVLERTLGRGSRAWRASEGGDHRSFAVSSFRSSFALGRLISFQCSALAL